MIPTTPDAVRLTMAMINLFEQLGYTATAGVQTPFDGRPYPTAPAWRLDSESPQTLPTTYIFELVPNRLISAVMVHGKDSRVDLITTCSTRGHIDWRDLKNHVTARISMLLKLT